MSRSTGPTGEGLTHIDAAGRASMVDVSRKPWTLRRAVARCRVETSAAGRAALLGERSAAGGAGDEGLSPSLGVGVGVGVAALFGAARVAGIQAAKRTSELIPLCHPLLVSDVQVYLSMTGASIEIEAIAEVLGPTGVEMEALTACATAALTVVGALLPLDPETTIEDLTLWEKAGGRSGTWRRG